MSHPDNGVNHYGLTDVGKKQAVEVSTHWSQFECVQEGMWGPEYYSTTSTVAVE